MARVAIAAPTTAAATAAIFPARLVPEGRSRTLCLADLAALLTRLMNVVFVALVLDRPLLAAAFDRLAGLLRFVAIEAPG
jgi:hypothetical protein